METIRISDIISTLEDFAPPALQEDYDNSGLQTGTPAATCTGVLVTLDCTEETIREAVQKGCNLVVCHHPVIFGGLKRLTGATYQERVVIDAIKKDVTIYAAHTNLDNVAGGVNSEICRKIGLSNTSILSPKAGELRRLIVFCPLEHAEIVRMAVFRAGAGTIGNYDQCSFNTTGHGTFRALEGADPFVGEVGERHQEEEVKVETIYPLYLERAVLKAMHEVHPYEEVAYDIIPLANADKYIGSGMIGLLEEPLMPMDFLNHLKSSMALNCIRYTEVGEKPIKKVAVCGGSGSFLLKMAIAAGADVFVTADFKYHQFFDADRRIVIADIGHFESERFTVDLLARVITEKFPKFAVRISETLKNPVNYLI